jgi:hypothetical protein
MKNIHPPLLTHAMLQCFDIWCRLLTDNIASSLKDASEMSVNISCFSPLCVKVVIGSDYFATA